MCLCWQAVVEEVVLVLSFIVLALEAAEAAQVVA
jgi:hypothetical protein